MSLQWISIILGILALAGGLMGVFRPDLARRFMELFPRSVVPAWIFTALCCWLGAKEAAAMNMGAVDIIKPFILFIAVGVFAASVIYMKELLAARALGGFLLLLAVPIIKTAAFSGAPLFQILVAVIYLWVIAGIVLLLSPWYFRKSCAPFIEKPALLKTASAVKVAVGVMFILLGIFVY